MPFEKPRFAGVTGKQREEVISPCPVTPLDPRTNDSYRDTYIGSDGRTRIPYDVDITPQYHGQLIGYKRMGINEMRFFVAVEVGGTISWKETDLYSYAKNSYTGRPWDPLSDR